MKKSDSPLFPILFIIIPILSDLNFREAVFDPSIAPANAEIPEDPSIKCSYFVVLSLMCLRIFLRPESYILHVSKLTSKDSTFIYFEKNLLMMYSGLGQ